MFFGYVIGKDVDVFYFIPIGIMWFGYAIFCYKFLPISQKLRD